MVHRRTHWPLDRPSGCPQPEREFDWTFGAPSLKPWKSRIHRVLLLEAILLLVVHGIMVQDVSTLSVSKRRLGAGRLLLAETTARQRISSFPLLSVQYRNDLRVLALAWRTAWFGTTSAQCDGGHRDFASLSAAEASHLADQRLAGGSDTMGGTAEVHVPLQEVYWLSCGLQTCTCLRCPRFRNAKKTPTFNEKTSREGKKHGFLGRSGAGVQRRRSGEGRGRREESGSSGGATIKFFHIKKCIYRF